MVGDYHRYISENCNDEAKLEYSKQKTLAAYNAANNNDMSACHPIKLGLALSYSVFQYEVMSEHTKAREMAENALGEALENIADLEDLDEANSRDAK